MPSTDVQSIIGSSTVATSVTYYMTEAYAYNYDGYSDSDDDYSGDYDDVDFRVRPKSGSLSRTFLGPK